MKEYTRAVLERAGNLSRLETAAAALPSPACFDFRAGWAALVAVLLLLLPSVSAAQMLI